MYFLIEFSKKPQTPKSKKSEHCSWNLNRSKSFRQHSCILWKQWFIRIVKQIRISFNKILSKPAYFCETIFKQFICISSYDQLNMKKLYLFHDDFFIQVNKTKRDSTTLRRLYVQNHLHTCIYLYIFIQSFFFSRRSIYPVV